MDKKTSFLSADTASVVSLRLLRRLLTGVLLLLPAAAALVVLLDPFYHYHRPWFGLKAVLSDKEYQCVGSLRHFDYDAVLVGSSVVENNDNHWWDNAYGCTTIKAVRSYGATADLCYLLDEAFGTHAVQKVFFNIDPSSLYASVETTYASTGCPMYLYDRNPFNDFPYLFNKDVLLEKIPYLIVNSFFVDYNEGLSYNWAEGKSFGEESVLENYMRAPEISPMLPETVYAEALAGNLSLLTAQLEAHPDTTFYFFFPAYSMLWWDVVYRSGERDAILYNEAQAIRTLLQYDNAAVYFFQDVPDIVTNLDNYMDPIHFSPDINLWMLQQMTLGNHRLTNENYRDAIDSMRALSDEIVQTKMYALEAQHQLRYAQP